MGNRSNEDLRIFEMSFDIFPILPYNDGGYFPMTNSASHRLSSMHTLQEAKVRRRGYIFFFVSGATALTYEIIWVRLLGFVFGNTTFAISSILTAYMAGLGLGSYWVGRFADRWRRPLWGYGCLEIGVGVYAAFSFLLLKGIQTLYITFAQHIDPGLTLFTALRLLLSFVVFFIPTFFMGATLPVLAKFYIRRADVIGPEMAILYGLNTAGAVTGTFLTGFLLLPLYSMHTLLAMAVTLNIGIGLFACMLSNPLESMEVDRMTQVTPKVDHRNADPPPLSPRLSRWLLIGIIVSGAAAMIYQVSWTRILASVLGSSTYAFTLMLVTFLLGLALGSTASEYLMTRRAPRLSDWGWLQLIIAFSAMTTLPLFAQVGMITVRLFAITIGHPNGLELIRFMICSVFMIVPTFCFGALFPVSTAIYAKNPKILGRQVGILYLANTCGNILGSLSAGFFLIPLIGIYRTILIAISAGCGIGLWALWVDLRRLFSRLVLTGGTVLSLIGGLWSMGSGWDPHLITSGLHIYPQSMMTQKSVEILAWLYDQQILFYREGLNSIISVGQFGENRYLKINGKTDASNNLNDDMITQVLSGHLPLLLHPNPRRTLVIGFGSGTTLGAVLAHPIIQADSVEIEPAVLAAAPYFDPINHKSYRDLRVRSFLNDARNHLLIERGNYDVIISEPSNPWMAGMANLFTVEFYQLVLQHLSSDGILCQWMHAYSVSPNDVQMVIASVQKVFPHVTLWEGVTGDFLIIASPKLIRFDLDRIQERIDRFPQIRQELSQFGIQGAAGLLSLFFLGEKDVHNYARHALLNTDDHLLLEFSAPKALYESTLQLVRQTLVRYRTERLPLIQTSGMTLDKRPEMLTQIGEGYLNKQRVDEARDYFQKALLLDPKLTAAQVGLGRCHLASGQLLTALSLFVEAVHQNPKSADAEAYLGLARLKGGNDKGSLEALQKATAMDETRWEFLYWKGEALEHLKQWPEAVEVYARCRILKPDHIATQLRYAHALIESGKPQEAVEWLEPLRRHFVTYEPIYEELRLAYQSMRQIEPAIALYEELVRLNPYHSRYWAILASLYSEKGDLRAFKRAIRYGKRTNRYFLEELSVPNQM